MKTEVSPAARPRWLPQPKGYIQHIQHRGLFYHLKVKRRALKTETLNIAFLLPWQDEQQINCISTSLLLLDGMSVK